MKGWTRQLEELSSLVAKLQVEKGQLQQRSRILESSLAANTHHEERLHGDEVPPPFCPPSPSILPAHHHHFIHSGSKRLSARCFRARGTSLYAYQMKTGKQWA